jgi:hypothetical protein
VPRFICDLGCFLSNLEAISEQSLSDTFVFVDGHSGGDGGFLRGSIWDSSEKLQRAKSLLNGQI